MWTALDAIRTKIDTLNVSNTSGKAKTEMQKKVAPLESHNQHGASVWAPSEQSNGSPCLQHMRAGTFPRWHFTIDVDWVPGSEVGLEGLLDFCDRRSLKATIFVAGRFAEN